MLISTTAVGVFHTFMGSTEGLKFKLNSMNSELYGNYWWGSESSGLALSSSCPWVTWHLGQCYPVSSSQNIPKAPLPHCCAQPTSVCIPLSSVLRCLEGLFSVSYKRSCLSDGKGLAETKRFTSAGTIALPASLLLCPLLLGTRGF